LLAPTGSDLQKNPKGSILAGFHYDISFLTIHGKSRFPGLYVWLRNNQKLAVKIPDGCLLLQSGITFEHITGGYVHAGFHEVVVTESTVQAYEKAKESGNIPWRISSTLFANFRSSAECYPLLGISHLTSEEDKIKYPRRSAYDILMTEI
jgi:isopenicillin N synthase-like dioxygenase